MSLKILINKRLAATRVKLCRKGVKKLRLNIDTRLIAVALMVPNRFAIRRPGVKLRVAMNRPSPVINPISVGLTPNRR